MCADSPYTLSSFQDEGISGFTKGAGGVCQVIYQYHVPICYITNDSHSCYFIGSPAVFIANDEVSFEMVSIIPGAFYPSNIRRCENGSVFINCSLQIWDKNGIAFQV